MNTELINSGAKLLAIAIDLCCFSIALACAWACSSALMAVVVFILMAMVMMIIATLLKVIAVMRLSPETLESVGRVYDRIAAMPAQVRARFVRNAEPVAA